MNDKAKNKKSQKPALIADNRRARHDFFIEDTFEAGMQLEGWEVKSLREGRGQITESFVQIKNGEAWIFGSSITPLLSASSHVRPEARRSRKLLLHRTEIDRLVGAVERKGYTLVPLNLHWSKGRVKLSIGLGKGKKQHDKRSDAKDRDWARDKARILKGNR